MVSFFFSISSDCLLLQKIPHQILTKKITILSRVHSSSINEYTRDLILFNSVMADEPKNAIKNVHTYSSFKKNSIDKKNANNAFNADLKPMGKTPFTISIEIPRGSKGFGFSVTWVQPVRVARVVQDSPADQAGLKVGDRIIFIGQENVVKASDKSILKLIKNERNSLLLEVYRRGLANIANLTPKDIRQLEGISDSPASTSRFSHQSYISDYGSNTPTLLRGDKGLGSRVFSNRIAGFNTPPVKRADFGRQSNSWSRLSHESHSSIDDGRRQAIYQLVTCEENFANLTYFGLERYVEPLRNKSAIISSTEHIVLFQNIEELVWLSEGFVEKIMEGDLNSVGNAIGGIYQEKILQLCGAYQFYCNGINAADALLTSKMLNPSFLQFLQDPPIPRERLDITSFIHRPVEHFREVLLLLQTILAHTETRHADYDPLENVVETMKLYYKDITSTLDLLDPRIGTTATSGCNQITAITTGTTMEDLEQRLVFTKSAKPFKLCEPGRQWVFGSELQKQDGKTMKACWVMLFTDILVFTRVGRDKVLFVNEDPIPVTSISRTYFNIKKKNTEFRLIVDRPKDNQNALLAGLQKRHRAIVLRAESLELKTMWQSYIQRQMWLYRGHEQNSMVNMGTPGTARKLWQTGSCALELNQKTNTQLSSKKLTGTFVLGKKNKNKEPTFGRILPSSSGKRQFLLDFLEGKGRHIGKTYETELPDWEFEDPMVNIKEEELVKLRQQMLTKKLPNYFEGEYEEFFFDDDEDDHKSSRGSDNITHSPAPTIRSNLSTPQRKHKVSPAMKPKKLSFHLPNSEIKQDGFVKNIDENKAIIHASVEITDKLRCIDLKEKGVTEGSTFAHIADTLRGSLEKLFHGSPLMKARESPKLKPKMSPNLKEKFKSKLDEMRCESPLILAKNAQNSEIKEQKDPVIKNLGKQNSTSENDISARKIVDESKKSQVSDSFLNKTDFLENKTINPLEVKNSVETTETKTMEITNENTHSLVSSLSLNKEKALDEKNDEMRSETLQSTPVGKNIIDDKSDDKVVDAGSEKNNVDSSQTFITNPELKDKEILSLDSLTDSAANIVKIATDSSTVSSSSETLTEVSPLLKPKMNPLLVSKGSLMGSSSSEASSGERLNADLTGSVDSKMDTKFPDKSSVINSLIMQEQKTFGELVPKTPKISHREIRQMDLKLTSKAKSPAAADPRLSGMAAFAKSLTDSPVLKPRLVKSVGQLKETNPPDSPKILKERVQIRNLGERQKVQMTYVESPLMKHREIKVMQFSPVLAQKNDKIVNILMHHEKPASQAEKTILDSPFLRRKISTDSPFKEKLIDSPYKDKLNSSLLDKDNEFIKLKDNSSLCSSDTVSEIKKIKDVFTKSGPEFEGSKNDDLLMSSNLTDIKNIKADIPTFTAQSDKLQVTSDIIPVQLIQEDQEKIESMEKVEPLVESTCTERKANSETSSGYQSEKASTDSPAVMHKETKNNKSLLNKDEKPDGENLDMKSVNRTSPKEKDRTDKNNSSITESKMESKNDKINKDSPLFKHKEAKLSGKESEKAFLINESGQVTKGSLEGVSEAQNEKNAGKEKRLMRQESKSIKLPLDQKQKASTPSGLSPGVISPKVEGKLKTSPSTVTKTSSKTKETTKKETKKTDVGKKAATSIDGKQVKAPTKTADPSKIKSSEKVKKESIKSDKGKDAESSKKSDKNSSEKVKDSKDKKDISSSIKDKDPKKLSTPKLNGEMKSKDSDENLHESKSDIKKAATDSVTLDGETNGGGQELVKDDPSVPIAIQEKLSEDLSKHKLNEPETGESNVPIQAVSEGSEKKRDKKNESLQRQETKTSKTDETVKEKSKSASKNGKKTDDKKPQVKDSSKSPQMSDVKTRIRSRLESKTMEGRSREGSPRLKKMCNDNKEFYFDADIEKDYPELIGTPRMTRKESIIHNAVRRCGSVIENRRCGSFEEIQKLSNHAEQLKSKELLWSTLGQRKESFNSHSDRELTPIRKMSSSRVPANIESTAIATGNVNSFVAVKDNEPCLESFQTSCPPGSGHCGEDNFDRYLCYRRDSYNSHTHRELPFEDCIVEIHRTGSGRSQGKEKKQTVAWKDECKGAPSTAHVNHNVDYEIPHCVIHNHKKNWREAMVYSVQKDFEISESSHCGDIADLKANVEFVIPNGDELGRLGSSLDDMLKCEVWLMNQCGNVELSSAKQSSMSEGNSSTLYQTKSVVEKITEGSTRKSSKPKCEPASESPINEKEIAFANNVPCSSAETPRLPSDDYKTTKKGLVDEPNAEEKGLPKILNQKAADIAKNDLVQSPKLNSHCDKKINKDVILDSGISGEELRKDSELSHTGQHASIRKSDPSASNNMNGVYESSSTARPLCVRVKTGTTALPNQSNSHKMNPDSVVNNCISTLDHVGTDRSDQVVSAHICNQPLSTRAEDINFTASTSKGGIYADDMEKPCCSRTLLPNDLLDEDSLDSDLFDTVNPFVDSFHCGDEWQSNGSIPGLMTAGTRDGSKKKSNIKMGVKSKTGSKGESPLAKQLVNSPPLTNQSNIEVSQRRQSTGSLLKQEDEKKGRFSSIFRRSASPNKIKDIPEDRNGQVPVMKRNREETKPETIKGSWFPWRSPWRKALHDCASLPATPPTHTPILLPRESNAVPSTARHGSDGDLGSWYDDE